MIEEKALDRLRADEKLRMLDRRRWDNSNPRRLGLESRRSSSIALGRDVRLAADMLPLGEICKAAMVLRGVAI